MVARYLLTISFVLLSVNALFIEVGFFEGIVEKNLLRLVVITIILFTIILSRPKIKTSVIILMSLLASLGLVKFNIDQLTLVYMLLIVTASAIFNKDELIRSLFIASSITFIFIFLFLALDVSYNEIRDFRNRSTYGLNGIGGPTLFFNILFSFLILGCVHFHRIKKKIFEIVSIFACIYFYTETDVRGGAIAFIAFLAFQYSMPFLVRFRTITFAIKILPVIFLNIAIVMSVLPNNEFYNALLSNRPELYSILLEKITLSDVLLGASVKSYDLISIVDNSFIHLFIGGGMAFFVYYAYLHFFRMKALLVVKDYQKIAFILGVSLYFFVESLAVRIENMFVILYWVILFTGINHKPLKRHE